MTSSEAVRGLRHAMIQKSADLLELWAGDPALLGLPAGLPVAALHLLRGEAPPARRACEECLRDEGLAAEVRGEALRLLAVCTILEEERASVTVRAVKEAVRQFRKAGDRSGTALSKLCVVEAAARTGGDLTVRVAAKEAEAVKVEDPVIADHIRRTLDVLAPGSADRTARRYDSAVMRPSGGRSRPTKELIRLRVLTVSEHITGMERELVRDGLSETGKALGAAVLHLWSGDTGQAAQWAERAERTALEHDDFAAAAEALRIAGNAAAENDRPQDAEETLLRALDLTRQDPEGRALIHIDLARIIADQVGGRVGTVSVRLHRRRAARLVRRLETPVADAVRSRLMALSPDPRRRDVAAEMDPASAHRPDAERVHLRAMWALTDLLASDPVEAADQLTEALEYCDDRPAVADLLPEACRRAAVAWLRALTGEPPAEETDDRTILRQLIEKANRAVDTGDPDQVGTAASVATEWAGHLGLPLVEEDCEILTARIALRLGIHESATQLVVVAVTAMTRHDTLRVARAWRVLADVVERHSLEGDARALVEDHFSGEATPEYILSSIVELWRNSGDQAREAAAMDDLAAHLERRGHEHRAMTLRDRAVRLRREVSGRDE